MTTTKRSSTPTPYYRTRRSGPHGGNWRAARQSAAQAAAEANAAARGNALTRFIVALEEANTHGEADPDTGSEAFARYYDAVIQGMAVQATDGASVGQLNGIVALALANWPAINLLHGGRVSPARRP